MRILVYGAGVLGCNLANNLYHAKKGRDSVSQGYLGKTVKEKRLTYEKDLSYAGERKPRTGHHTA